MTLQLSKPAQNVVVSVVLSVVKGPHWTLLLNGCVRQNLRIESRE